MPATNIRHVGLVVQDLQKSMHFYCELLGFKVKSQQLENGHYISAMLGFPDAEVETVKMELEPNGSLLELLHFKNPSGKKSELRKLNSSGFTHFAMTVKNLESLYNNLVSANIKFVGQPVVTENKYAKVAFCQDPEGNYLELTEVL